VAHWGIPQNGIAGFYQESGRAGRDGKLSFCRIYHSKDVIPDQKSIHLVARDGYFFCLIILQERNTLGFLIRQEIGQKKKNDTQAKAIMASFEAMVKFVEKGSCRHAYFASYFGDKVQVCGDMCDFCKNPKQVRIKCMKPNSVVRLIRSLFIFNVFTAQCRWRMGSRDLSTRILFELIVPSQG